MTRRLKANTGMSLVEATIILMTLAILTAVLSPSINDYVADARGVKAKEDVEAIGISIARLLKDTGYPFLIEDGTVTALDRFKMANRADLVAGSGNIPEVFTGVNSGLSTDSTAIQGAVGWTNTVNDGNGAGKMSLYSQLVANVPNYTSPTSAIGTAIPTAPGSLGRFSLGWRGSYLNGVIGPDPWGFRYVCSSVFLGTATDATNATNGGASVGWRDDAVCLSSGQNNQIELDFQNGSLGSTHFAGSQNDDVIFVISGFGK